MFKVGQKVWCILRGEGQVILVSGSSVAVSFGENVGIIYYTLDGRTSHRYKNRMLWFSKPVITGQETPPFQGIFEIGETIIAVMKGSDTTVIGKVVEETQHMFKIEGTGMRYKANYSFYKLGKEIS